jgi:large subunit ribosomal protein L23
MKTVGEIVIAPRITEKGAYLTEHGAYVFNVGKNANKQEIAMAIRTLYKVTPRKVTVLAVRAKSTTSRVGRGQTRSGKTAAGRKAYVYLKKGEAIEIV